MKNHIFRQNPSKKRCNVMEPSNKSILRVKEDVRFNEDGFCERFVPVPDWKRLLPQPWQTLKSWPFFWSCATRSLSLASSPSSLEDFWRISSCNCFSESAFPAERQWTRLKMSFGLKSWFHLYLLIDLFIFWFQLCIVSFHRSQMYARLKKSSVLDA